MSGTDDGAPQPGGDGNKPPKRVGRRKDGKPYKDGNTRDDGSYAVGKNRTPVQTRFGVGDGRKRGRRDKGVKNADTEFERELKRKMTIRESGVERKVSKSLGVDLRMLDNALSKGNNRAIEMVDQRRRRIAEAKEDNRRYHSLTDEEILHKYLRERAKERARDAQFCGDPEPDDDGDPDNDPPDSNDDRDSLDG